MDGESGAQERASEKGRWLADTVRLSLFVGEGHVWPASLMGRLIGQSAEIEQTSKRGGMTTVLEAVRLGRHQINVIAQPVRLDMHVTVAQEPEDSDDVVRPVEDFRDLLTAAAGNASALAPFVRLGTSAGLIRPCVGKVEVYKAINERFPCLGIDPENADDLLVQMNHVLDDTGRRINRIERWSFGCFERIDIPVMGVTSQVALSTKRVEGVKLDLDFNTAADADVSFNAEDAKSIVQSLVDAMYVKIEAE